MINSNRRKLQETCLTLIRAGADVNAVAKVYINYKMNIFNKLFIG